MTEITVMHTPTMVAATGKIWLERLLAGFSKAYVLILDFKKIIRC